jgi:aromatic ring-opening dioxygenase catalytic subunit (LigB family)
MSNDNDQSPTRDQSRQRMPVVFIPHGGGPWPFVELGLDRDEVAKLIAYLQSLRTVASTAPKALLVVSAHWEAPVPTVMTAERPPMLYDYRGFPPASYEIEWPAPGDPGLAARVRELLGRAGFETAADDARGYDHGTFIPLKVTYPGAEIPAVQLSLMRSLDPEEHLRMGRALAPLREEGVLILGSGMSFHNLRTFRDPRARPSAEAFDAWLRETALLDREARDRRLVEWTLAPSARAVHPREEHLLPLMVVAGAAGDDRGTIAYNEPYMGMPITAVHFA